MLSDICRSDSSPGAVVVEECRVFYRYAEIYDEPVLNQLRDIIYRNTADLSSDW